MKQKYIYFIISILFVMLIIFNATFINLNNLWESQSFIAMISIIATLCALILLWLLFMAKKFTNSDKK